MKTLTAIVLVALCGCATVKPKVENHYPENTVIKIGDRFYVREENRWNVVWRGQHWMYDDVSQRTRDWLKEMIRKGEAIQYPSDYDYLRDTSIR